MAGQCWCHDSLPVSTLSAEKLPLLPVGGDGSDTPSWLTPRPPKAPATCDAAGICSIARARSVTPHVMNVLFSGLYELAGQSIISNGMTTYCVVSYGS